MYGSPNSIKIIHKINSFVNSDKNNKKYRTIIATPYTLLESFNKTFLNKKTQIAAQNCFHKDYYSSNTGAVSAYMIKQLGIKNIIIGHSDNRAEGDNDKTLKLKLNFAKNYNLKIIYCIGENLKEKKRGDTFKVLKKQILSVIDKNSYPNKLIVAYEPIWSIGTGLIPTNSELNKTILFIKKILKNLFKNKIIPPVLYGGSVDGKNVNLFKNLSVIDGFLIGGASKSHKKFIDIIKNYYR